MARRRIATSVALLAVLFGGGVAYAGDYTPASPGCDPVQAGNLIGGVQTCPINVDPDVAVDPVVTLPVIVDLQ